MTSDKTLKKRRDKRHKALVAAAAAAGLSLAAYCEVQGSGPMGAGGPPPSKPAPSKPIGPKK